MVYVKTSTLWYWIAAAMVVVWIFAFASSFGGGAIHLLPVIAGVIFAVNLMKNRGAP